MSTGSLSTRHTVFSTGLVIGGATVAPLLPFVGIPLASVGLAALAFGGKGFFAGVVSAIGVGVVTFLDPTAALFIAPVMAAVLVSLPWLRSRSALSVGAVYVTVIMLASIVADAVSAFLAGTTLIDSVRNGVDMAIEQATGAVGALGLGGAGDEVLGLWRELMIRTWPLGYFETAMITGFLTVACVGLGAARSSTEVNRLPRLKDVDLSVHVLWPLVVGLFLLAAERFIGESGRTLGTVGLNLLLGARWLFFIQGMAVGAALMDRLNAGRGRRIVSYVLMVLADTMFYAMSFVGLFDFWMNVRKLERKDGKTDASLEGPTS